MSFAKDVLGFEKFNLKDMWKKVRKDPERLLLGAMDPFSTRMWNKTGIGKDWEPVVDQMGGAYGGNTLTMGDTGEGVYGRAKAAGVPTKAGSQMHDLAHVITSMFAGNYGMGKLPAGVQRGFGQFNKFPSGGGGGGRGFGQPAQQDDAAAMQAFLAEMARRQAAARVAQTGVSSQGQASVVRV